MKISIEILLRICSKCHLCIRMNAFHMSSQNKSIVECYSVNRFKEHYIKSYVFLLCRKQRYSISASISSNTTINGDSGNASQEEHDDEQERYFDKIERIKRTQNEVNDKINKNFLIPKNGLIWF